MAKSEEPVTDKAAGKKGGKSGIIIIAVAVVVAGVMGFFTAKMFQHPAPEAKPEKIEIPDSLEGLPNYEDIRIDQITVNPISKSKRTAVYMISLGFQVKPKGIATEEFKEKDMVIRDDIISYLSSKKAEFYADPKFREVVKTELKRRLSKRLEKSEIMEVYITYSLLSM